MERPRIARLVLALATAGLLLVAGWTVVAGMVEPSAEEPDENVPEEGAPLVAVQEAPPSPPVALLVQAREGGWAVLQQGALFNYEWVIEDVVRQVDGGVPVPWPQPVTVSKGSDEKLAVTFGVVSDPTLIEVRVFEGLNRLGEPLTDPVRVFQCGQSATDSRRCGRTPAGYVSVPLPGLSRGQYRVTVFGTWYFSMAKAEQLHLGRDAPRDLTSTWLFAVDMGS